MSNNLLRKKFNYISRFNLIRLITTISLFLTIPIFSQDVVILLHGLARTNSSMDKFIKPLQKENYKVINVDYPSRKYSLKELVSIVNENISLYSMNSKNKLNFICYSLGCLVTRGIIHNFKPKNLGRVVMFGPPNQGSESADFISNSWIFKNIFGPVLQDLKTDQTQLGEYLGTVNYELGIIAGNSSIDFISSYFIIPNADDGRVSIESTKLFGMKEHIIVNVSHTFLIRNEDVIKKSINFIKLGKFN